MHSHATLPLGPLLFAATLLLTGCGQDSAPDSKIGAMDGRSGTTAATASTLQKLGAAPAWRLPRLDGTTLDSNELKGKVVVVDFWATWCGPCIREIPGYVEIQKKYADRGLVIVGISMDQRGQAVVQRFIEQHGINYPIVMGDEAVTEAFGGVQAIPTTFLIDRDGQIRHRKVGAMEREEYEPIVASLL
jgi:peroxiredoxin